MFAKNVALERERDRERERERGIDCEGEGETALLNQIQKIHFEVDLPFRHV